MKKRKMFYSTPSRGTFAVMMYIEPLLVITNVMNVFTQKKTQGTRIIQLNLLLQSISLII